MDINLLFDFSLKIIVGFFIGVAIGSTGIGGGALIQPALIHILGMSPVSAVGTGLAYAMITKGGGVISHLKLKTIRIRRASYFLFGSIPGVFGGAEIVNYIVAKYSPTKINTYLQLTMGTILLITAVILFIQIFYLNNKLRISRIENSKKLPVSTFKKILAITAGAFIGILIGATSIGGGILIIPIFFLLLDADGKQAVGTSIAISLFLSASGSIIYLFHGHIDIPTALLLCLGSLPGVSIGSRLLKKIPEHFLVIILILIITLSGISLFFGSSKYKLSTHSLSQDLMSKYTWLNIF